MSCFWSSREVLLADFFCRFWQLLGCFLGGEGIGRGRGAVAYCVGPLVHQRQGQFGSGVGMEQNGTLGQQ